MHAIRKHLAAAVVLTLFCLAPAGLLLAEDSPCIEKRIIGQECWVHIEELDLDLLARVDTGATTTSLHATDFFIEGGTEDPRDNLGLTINFLTVSTEGRHRRMSGKIAGIQTVVSAQGREKRYMVRLTLTGRGVTKNILANLRDRSRLKYKLLLGRDWLAEDFLVDVSREATKGTEEGEEERRSGRFTFSRRPGTPAF